MAQVVRGVLRTVWGVEELNSRLENIVCLKGLRSV
jgi:hypothetical protein